MSWRTNDSYTFLSHGAKAPGSTHAELASGPRFVVDATALQKRYQVGGTTVSALSGVSLRVAPGEFLAISGPSGSGKSTLLSLLGCLELPTEGELKVCGYAAAALSEAERAATRARVIGFIFQSFNLIPVLTAFENVELPLNLLGLSGRERKERTAAALERVGLLSHARHRPAQLSGGQRQRVAIARAMVHQPRLVLADEPTANLDHKTGLDVLELMKAMNQESGTTFIFSTHDPKVMECASRIVRLEDGAISEEGV